MRVIRCHCLHDFLQGKQGAVDIPGFDLALPCCVGLRRVLGSRQVHEHQLAVHRHAPRVVDPLHDQGEDGMRSGTVLVLRASGNGRDSKAYSQKRARCATQEKRHKAHTMSVAPVARFVAPRFSTL